MVGQHHVLIAVVVEVADSHTGAIGFEVIDRVAGDGGDMIKGGGDEAASARLGGRVQRYSRYSQRNFASLGSAMCQRRGGCQTGQSQHHERTENRKTLGVCDVRHGT